MPKEDFRFHTPLRVRWKEGDAQRIVYYGAYLDYMEIGQAEYYRNLGFSIYQLGERGYFDTAVVKVTVEYRAPARVDDLLEAYVRVSHIGSTSIVMDMEIHLSGSDTLTTQGQVVYAGFDPATGTKRPVPQPIREIIDSYETSGEILPLDRFPDLAQAAR